MDFAMADMETMVTLLWCIMVLLGICAAGVTVLAYTFWVHEFSVRSFKDLFLDYTRNNPQKPESLEYSRRDKE